MDIALIRLRFERRSRMVLKNHMCCRLVEVFHVRSCDAKESVLKYVLMLTYSLAAGPAHAASSSWLQDQTLNMHQIQGPFMSTDFGFSVSAPPDVAEYVTNGGDANHGPTLILGDKRKIVVYPAYTGLTFGDDKPCRPNQFPWEPGSKKSSSIGKIGHRNASVMTFIQGSTVWRIAQTTGHDRGTSIMYTVLLTTTRRWSRVGVSAFMRVADTVKSNTLTP